MSIFCKIFLCGLAIILFLLVFLSITSLIFEEQIKNLIVRYYVSKGKRNAFTVAKSRSYYKVFLDTIRTKNLYPYTLPKMPYKEIVNMLEIPELNINYCLLSEHFQNVVDNDGMLVVYTWKKDCEDSVSRWFNSEFLRNKNGLILFVPKSYKDYRKLCDYLGDKINSQKDDGVRNAQMESLKYLANLIHEVQDKHRETLQDCQLEMDREIRECKAQNPYFRNRSDSANEK